MRFEPVLVSSALLLGGCDGRGVDLGSEELCVQDPLLALANAASLASERVSPCASIGNNLLGNPNFETPDVASCTRPDGYCWFPSAQVPSWSSNSEQGIIEIWSDGHDGVEASEGAQFVELSAESQDTLWQDFELPEGQTLYWSVLHRGRFGIDTFEVHLGPPEAPSSRGVFTSDQETWRPYSGLYRVPDGEPLTRFALVSRTGRNHGNFVDATFLAPVD